MTIFWLLFVLGLIVRAVYFGTIPNGINQDEAFAAMDGWALALYGTDHYGMAWPVHLTAWEYGQMSALLSYCMIPFIKLMGFSIVSIRMPLLFFSMLSIVLMFLIGKELKSTEFGLALMALTVINPWHFMQSRWSLDCNLFPHVFLIGFLLLLYGLRKRWCLCISMLFFALSLYCYGIAVYTVVPFLFVYALIGVIQKKIKIYEALICAALFLIVSGPELLVMAINFFGWNTVNIGPITVARFYESVRSNDILFINFSFSQLARNIWYLLRTVFLQFPDNYYNSIPLFGPLYHISIPFSIVGIVLYVREWFSKKDLKALAVIGFTIMGIWAGIVTFEVNVNRVNIIYFPLIIATVKGMEFVVHQLMNKRIIWGKWVIGGVFCSLFVAFLISYFTIVPKKCVDFYNVDYLEAVDYADSLSPNKLYVSSNMGWQTNYRMADILLQYELKIDPLFYQGKTDIDGKKYSDIYHFYDFSYLNTLDFEEGDLIILPEKESKELNTSTELLESFGCFEVRKCRMSEDND